MNKQLISTVAVREKAIRYAERVASGGRFASGDTINVFGIPRGGCVPAAMFVEALRVFGYRNALQVDCVLDAHIIVDDIMDSGKTRDSHMASYPHAQFIALFSKPEKDVWYIFPWELTDEGEDVGAEDIPIRLLQYIGEDPKRGGLEETPRRFLKAWEEWTSGYELDPVDILKTFVDGSEGCDELVLVKNIPVYSHCEHHLAPFFGVAHVGYIPDKRIVGLSKLPRLVEIFARRLQVQERLTNQVADAIENVLKPIGVAVVIECRHMCMESRGIQRQGSTTITSALRGGMKDDPSARAEFMGLIR
jgi:GTP cyclohydrolase I